MQRKLPLLYAAGTAAAAGIGVWIGPALGLFPTLGVIAAVAGLAGLVSHRVIERRLQGVAEIRRALVGLSRGDTSVRLTPTRLGEMAETGAAVNRVIDVLRTTRERVDELSQRLTALPEQIAAALEAVRRSADDQEAAVEETASLQANINNSIRGIAGEVENLARANDESASSTLELGSAVEQVARSAQALLETMESSTSALHEMNQNIRSVAESTDSVQQVAEETAVSVTSMDRAIQEVGTHVRGASELTERLSGSAEEGAQAVGATIQGIAEIRDVTVGAQKALEGLAERIGEIGDITTVIGSITDETNLLSLNAAIIAAQAGEHGRAFAVVADQVKELARRTSHGTQEIEQLIEAVQQQSQLAVEAMRAGIEAVETGVIRSRVAGDSLSAIRESASDASNRVAEIARAADEQSRNSKQVAEAARRTSELVQEISTAMSQQKDASDRLLANATSSVDMVRQMTSATEEQRASGHYITSNVESITEMIRSIQANVGAHEKASRAVAETFDTLLQNAHQSGARLPELTTAVDELRRYAEAMHDELKRFGTQDESDS